VYRKLLSLRGIALALSFTALHSMAWGGLFDDDEARKAILDLRQRIEANKTAQEAVDQKILEEIRKTNEENVQLRRGLIDLLNQLEQVRAEVARLRGQDEQLTRDTADMQKRLRDAVQSFDERLRKFEPVKVTLEGKEFLAEPGEKREFDAAMGVFRQGDFAAAQVAFLDFLKRFPRGGYAPSALFWLGNAQYATRDYKEAIANFKALLAASADHPRAGEALLSIANCQVELKDVKSARKTLEDLVKAYPDSEAAQAAKERLGKLK
jgi:tol-pal system protein YbgF